LATENESGNQILKKIKWINEGKLKGQISGLNEKQDGLQFIGEGTVIDDRYYLPQGQMVILQNEESYQMISILNNIETGEQNDFPIINLSSKSVSMKSLEESFQQQQVDRRISEMELN